LPLEDPGILRCEKGELGQSLHRREVDIDLALETLDVTDVTLSQVGLSKLDHVGEALVPRVEEQILVDQLQPLHLFEHLHDLLSHSGIYGLLGRQSNC